MEWVEFMLIRWRSIVGILLGLFAFHVLAQDDASHMDARSILVVGDSLSAEYGLERDTGWVEIIAQRLREENTGYVLHNRSISGDTSSGGLARLPEALERFKPSIVIIELGSNDALRGLPLDMTQQNLSRMVIMSKKAGARVLLVGMQVPPNYGRAYTERFRDIYTHIAKDQDVERVPFLLEGIALDRGLFQQDGLHPNEAAQPIMADTVWRHLAPMLTP